MKNKTFVFLLQGVAFILCLACTGCKKEEDKSINPIVGKWTMTAYIHNGVDVYGTQVPPCVIDDIATFTIDQKLINDEGPTKCSSSDPQTSEGTYSLNNDNSKLTIVYGGSSFEDNVLILNSTTLKLEQVSNDDLVTYTKVP